MDLATIVGVLLAFGGIFGAQVMEGGNPASLLLPAPMILVVCGTLGAAMASGVLKDATGLPKQIIRAFTAKTTTSGALVDAVVALAERARREGLLALEYAAKSVTDPFLRPGLEMAIDGTDPEELVYTFPCRIARTRKAAKEPRKICADLGR